MSDSSRTGDGGRGWLERMMFARFELWLVVLLLLGATIGSVVWTWAVLEREAFPHAIVMEIGEAIRGTPDDQRPLWKRLASPYVFLPRAFPEQPGTALVDEAAFRPVHLADDFPDPRPETGAMRVANPGGGLRFFLLWGSFVFPDTPSNIGAVLVDSGGTLHRAWPFEVPYSKRPGPQIGMDVADDGTIAVIGSGWLTAWNWCGGVRWQLAPRGGPGGYWPDENAVDGRAWHHDIDYGDGQFWTLLGIDLVAVDADTGEIAQVIRGIDLMKWGWEQGMNLFAARLDKFRWPALTEQTAPFLIPLDTLHTNKIDVLTAEDTARNPEFRSGDLLLSMRNLNLVLVVRPSEQKILWWRQGFTDWQHDATMADGAVEVFDNAPFSMPPRARILSLPLDDYRADTLFELADWGISMQVRGNFELDGDRLLTVDVESGRMIAGRLSGKIDVLFENGYDADGEERGVLTLRNATEISTEDFERLQAGCGR